MIRSAITVSLVPEVRSGPFVFCDGFEAACKSAAELGFDAVEIFPPDAAAIDAEAIRPILDRYQLNVAAVGSGAGWVKRQLTLTHSDRARREQAMQFVQELIDAAGELGAPVIIGSMQGKWGQGIEREEGFYYLASSLAGLSQYAAEKRGQRLIYEPLNRYETNFCNTIAQGVELLTTHSLNNVELLADLFHMNIEEQDLAAALVTGGRHIGHVHFADSNRRPIGSGHTPMAPITGALRAIAYDKYVSAECLAYPDSLTAAKMTIEAFRNLFPRLTPE